MKNRATIIVGDIGGTNARFGLVSAEEQSVSHIRSLSIHQHDSIETAIRAYLADMPDINLTQASLAVATPIHGDIVQLTNSRWSFSATGLCQQLGIETLKVLNDFTALALSIPTLSSDQSHQVGEGQAIANSAIGVIGPGTGLGVSGLIPTANGWVPLTGEGGHVSIGSTTDREAALFQMLRQQFGHLSAERLLSGTGVVEVYKTLRTLDRQQTDTLPAKEIAARAINNSCETCAEVMALFYGWLGVVAGNLALTLGAQGGIYIGGGIVPQLLGAFEQSTFRQRFEDRGRFSGYLKAIPTAVITEAHPTLTGAIHALAEQYNHIGMTCRRQTKISSINTNQT